MHEDRLCYLLGYPASFCLTPEEARRNILRMIEAGIPGWDAGLVAWQDALRQQLARPNRTRKLNRHGARFRAGEWVWLMRSLLHDCASRLAADPAPAGRSAPRDHQNSFAGAQQV